LVFRQQRYNKFDGRHVRLIGTAVSLQCEGFDLSPERLHGLQEEIKVEMTRIDNPKTQEHGSWMGYQH